MSVKCPACGGAIDLNSVVPGEKVECPACHKSFRTKPKTAVAQSTSARELPEPYAIAADPMLDRAQRAIATPTPSIKMPSPSPQQPYVPTINVNLPRRSSSLGIASVILGVLAFLICWIPFVGVLGLPISGLGVVLGAVGLVVAIVRKGSGVGYPIAGSAISGVALLIGFFQVAAISAAGSAVVQAADAAKEAGRQANRTNQFVPTPAPRPAPHRPGNQAARPQSPARPLVPTGLKNNPSGVPEKQPEPKEQVEWAAAPGPVQQGDVQVRIESVTRGLVPLLQKIGNAKTESEDSLLTIRVTIGNSSKNRKVEYSSWMGQTFSLGNDVASLTDNFENRYKRINFGFATEVIGSTMQDSIYPSKSVTDVLVFEDPIDTVEYLNLELPAANFGGTGVMRIRIPARMVKNR